MNNQIANYVRAGYSGLYIISHEEQRVESELRGVADVTGFELFAWSLTTGLVHVSDGEVIPETEDPLVVLQCIGKTPEKSIILLRDYHLHLADGPMLPATIRMLKDALVLGKNSNRVIVMIGCRLTMLPELEKEITVIEFKLPDRAQLLTILKGIATAAKVHLNGNTDAIVDAASGLTTTEAENTFALSVVEAKDIDADIVAREKANTVKKNGLLEIVPKNVTLENIGGLENLKRDLVEKKNLFTKEAREYGIPTPRGQLYCGNPGTGKSLCAQATGSIFNIPLVRLDAGRLFASHVGESEQNWRIAHSTVKAIAPCVFWVDEIDGLMTGAESSGKTDGGTTARVIKSILQDMQFNSEGIFFVFTCNDIDNLPDPLIDRLDVWSVDLPNQTEREQILAIQMTGFGKKVNKLNLTEAAAMLDGFSGRQMREVVVKSMVLGFNAGRPDPNNADLKEAASRFTPTSILMADAIERRRKRLLNRATPASAPEVKVAGTRKIVK